MLDVNKLAKGDRIIYSEGGVKRKYLKNQKSIPLKRNLRLDAEQHTIKHGKINGWKICIG